MASAPIQNLVDYVDILGQQPSLKIYTQIALCYALPDDTSHAAIIDTLTHGLRCLTASFPWVAGQLVNEGAREGNTGLFKITPLEDIPRLLVKDLRSDPLMPTFAALREADFPMSQLDEGLIAPRHTIPTPEEAASDWPVFLLQATFITGGLILTVNGQHNAMDMVGQGQIMSLLSKACRGEPFTGEELVSGNLPRRDTIPYLDESYQPGPEIERQILKPKPSDLPPPLPPPKSTWANFSFSSASLAALKEVAAKTLPSGFISTDDALTAFIWQSIIRARIPRLDPAVEVAFGRAVDVRRYLDVPSSYPGLVLSMTYHTSTGQNLVEESLGRIASGLRAAVDPKTSQLGYNTRALATFMHRSEDKSTVSATASFDFSKDLVLSSWAKVNCYDLDFGLGLGKPESVRRPRFIPVESLMYLLPRSPDGGITAAICLRDEDMERLKYDEEFKKYGKYLG